MLYFGLVSYKDFGTFFLIVILTSILMLVCQRDEIDFLVLKTSFKFNIFITSFLVAGFNFTSSNDILVLIKTIFIGLLLYIPISTLINYIEYSSNVVVNKQKIIFTNREKEIVELAIKEYSNKDIATELYVAESTVKKHIQNIFKKVDVTNKKELKEKLEHTEY